MKRLFVTALIFLALVCGVVWYSSGLTPPDFFRLMSSSQPEAVGSGRNFSPESQLFSSDEETRAVWVATAYNIDYPSSETADSAVLRDECEALLDQIQAAGGNTVYLQVRPAADALYSSALFPWSRYLTGTCGTAPENDFDPLAYWTEQAHARGMKLEAWINPYRICAGANAKSDFAALPASSPAKQHPDWVVQYQDEYYFNPALPEVRQLIADGVSEIVRSYEVDGIQFDDYFYPGADFDDDSQYDASDTTLSRADWRRDNVNQLVQLISETVHRDAKNAGCRFGISPSGIWRNKGINCFGGSDTHGFSHYESSYADSLTWIRNGWVDYICPQIYWEIGDSAADFETLANWWSRQVFNTKTELILGLAAYKIGDSNYGSVWSEDGCAEIGRQIDLSREIDGIDGFAVFSIGSMSDRLTGVLHEKWQD